MAEVMDANDLYPQPLSRPITVREAVAGVTPATMTDARVRWNSTYKANTTRRHWNRPFTTLTTRNASNGVHPSEDRYFSIEEIRRGAGFPDGFRFAGTAHQQSKQIGNCVPPPLMYAIAAQIRAALFGGRPLEQGRRVDYATLLDGLWRQHLAPRAADAPTVVSTFTGAGGSSLGYSMAGYRELLAVEWNGHAVETFRLNFPDVPVYHGDIAQLSANDCLRLAGIAAGELDVLEGSPPCQGFSTAGKRVLDDPRNQLFREYVRLLRGLQPRVFVMENVSGMVKGKMKLVFADALRELKAGGYVVSARLLNAKYFNVPQSRERLIFIGVREDIARGRATAGDEAEGED